jgi:glycosyltransferase involved in cell wall biosynthesis
MEIIVCDNNSSDTTEEIVKEYRREHDFIKYYKNERNLGYAGNQVKCIERAKGKYIAILCDDDAYVNDTLNSIFTVISKKEYSFIALNYYGFLKSSNKVFSTGFAPEKDMEFERGFDIMNYPSVGHFSGFVFNGVLAKSALNGILKSRKIEEYEKGRGIIVDLAIRVTLLSPSPSFFIGKRILATRIPKTVDYDMLYHLCIDCYEYFLSLFVEGLITRKDLDYRVRLVLARLPRAIISDASRLKKERLKEATEKLKKYFCGYISFRLLCYPMLIAVRLYPVKIAFIFTKKTARRLKLLYMRIKE